MRILIAICLLFAGIAGNAQQKDSTAVVLKEQKETLITLNKDSLANKVTKPYNAEGIKAILENKIYIQDGLVQVPYEPKSEAFLDRYMEIVYSKSQYIDSLNTHRMRFWKEPVKVYVDTSVPEQYGRALKKFATNLDNLVDSLSIRFVDSPDLSNYLIYHVNDQFSKEFEPNLETSAQGYYVYWKQYYKISQGYLKINTERITNPQMIQSLMKWRFFASLGYFNTQGDLPCEDYLSSCFEGDKKLSDDDIEILKYHYSYGICKGTLISKFKEQHKRAKASLAKNLNNRYFFAHPR
ncbi:MAG: hypothetical protein KJN96_08940 [Eudoraea sp.]|nr:hypothetical protein [Eudoraea sp.]